MCAMLENSEFVRIMDIKTPRNVHLSGFYKRSFAFRTVKKRMPYILNQINNNLLERKMKMNDKSRKEVEGIIKDIVDLKHEIETNQELKPLAENGGDDIHFYNKCILDQAREDAHATYFTSVWLLVECYMYRRIRQMFENTETLRDYDPFRNQKQQSFIQSLPIMEKVAKYLNNVLSRSEANKDDFINLLKLNLWSNKSDLSLSNGTVEAVDDEALDMGHLNDFILCNHSEMVWQTFLKSTSQIIDIVFDNAGYELFLDFCLADYLITTKLATKIRFYVKSIPWFISDVMFYDFQWVLDVLKTSKNEDLITLINKWMAYVKGGIWTVEIEGFWTLPVDFSQMKKVDPSLYKKLMQAKLIIFKGDLNYRKLFGEKNWNPDHSVDDALQGFHPTRLCSLRTVKSDIICGITEAKYNELEEKEPNWMETGEYGLIQFSDVISPL